MTDVKKLAVGAIVAGGLYYVYQTVMNLENQIIVGSPKFSGFSDGKILLTIPVSNISRVTVSFDGFNGYIDVKGGRVGDVVIKDQRKAIKANSSTSFTVEVIPNYFAIAFLGVDVIKLIKAGKLKDVKAALKGKGFSGPVSFDVNVPIV
jgi:hypothetical protein